MKPEVLAYIAGVIDAMGIIRTREYKTTAGVTKIPYVGVSCPDKRLLELIAFTTGTKVSTTRRNYLKGGCSLHCAEKHQHVRSESYRWSVTGAKATVLLTNIRPYLVLKAQDAAHALVLCDQSPYKDATMTKMAELGWRVPEQATA